MPTGEPGFDGKLGQCLTVGGRSFEVWEPDVGKIDLHDIAHALSNLCRYGGHTLKFYSVAQHCVHATEWSATVGADEEQQREVLMHDASEAYLVDVPRPIKRGRGFEGYLELEAILDHAIAKRFGLLDERPPIVKRADMVMLATERRDVMPQSEDPTLLWPRLEKP